jgi:hypothetical protein
VYSLGGWVLRNGSFHVGVGVMVMVVMATMANVAGIFTTFTYGLSNDRCDGSSSKNECNRELDLNHSGVMKCGKWFSDQRKSRVVRCGGMRPAEETGAIEAKFL